MDIAACIGCTIGELGERMTAAEFALWLARWRVEPFGPAALPRALAEICAAIANGPLQRKGAQGALWRPADFLPADPWAPQAAPRPGGPSLDEIKAFFGGRR